MKILDELVFGTGIGLCCIGIFTLIEYSIPLGIMLLFTGAINVIDIVLREEL